MGKLDTYKNNLCICAYAYIHTFTCALCTSLFSIYPSIAFFEYAVTNRQAHGQFRKCDVSAFAFWVLNDMRQFLTPRDQNASTARARGKKHESMRKPKAALEIETENQAKRRSKRQASERARWIEREGGREVERVRERRRTQLHALRHKFIWIGVGSEFKYFSANNKNNVN